MHSKPALRVQRKGHGAEAFDVEQQIGPVYYMREVEEARLEQVAHPRRARRRLPHPVERAVRDEVQSVVAWTKHKLTTIEYTLQVHSSRTEQVH